MDDALVVGKDARGPEGDRCDHGQREERQRQGLLLDGRAHSPLAKAGEQEGAQEAGREDDELDACEAGQSGEDHEGELRTPGGPLECRDRSRH